MWTGVSIGVEASESGQLARPFIWTATTIVLGRSIMSLADELPVDRWSSRRSDTNEWSRSVRRSRTRG